MKELFRKYWDYFISRNVPVWHDTLAVGFREHYRPFHIHPLEQARLHHGTHADFFIEHNSRVKYVADLEGILVSPEKFSHLRKKYISLSNALLIAAKNLTPTSSSILKFFHSYAKASPLLDMTTMANEVLTQRISLVLQGHPQRDELIAFYAAPRRLAPFQRLQRDIERIKAPYDLDRQARRLQRAYAWIPVNFIGESWGVTDFKNMVVRHERAKSKRAPSAPSVLLEPKTLRLLKLLGLIGELNEYRKEVFSRASLLVRPVFERIGREADLEGWRALTLCTHTEVIDLAKGKRIPPKVFAGRTKDFLLYPKLNQVKISTPEVAKRFRIAFAVSQNRQREVGGIRANAGKTTGRVKVIFEPKDFSKLKAGEILVAKMTSVDFIPIMRKASAFVTDEGGLASHAAIISREYNVPCIVGTKTATRVFKDGDQVEVDANSGIVKKI